MDVKEEELLGGAVGDHWYYRSKRLALDSMLQAGIPYRRILDVGAGSAIFSRHLLDRRAESAICVDSAYAADRCETYNGKVIRFAWEIAPGNADLVLLMDVLEHVDDDVGLIRAKPGGRCRGSFRPYQRSGISIALLGPRPLPGTQATLYDPIPGGGRRGSGIERGFVAIFLRHDFAARRGHPGSGARRAAQKQPPGAYTVRKFAADVCPSRRNSVLPVQQDWWIVGILPGAHSMSGRHSTPFGRRTGLQRKSGDPRRIQPPDARHGCGDCPSPRK